MELYKFLVVKSKLTFHFSFTTLLGTQGKGYMFYKPLLPMVSSLIEALPKYSRITSSGRIFRYPNGANTVQRVPTPQADEEGGCKVHRQIGFLIFS